MLAIDRIAEIVDEELPVLTERERRAFFAAVRDILNDREEVDAEPDAMGISKEQDLLCPG